MAPKVLIRLNQNSSAAPQPLVRAVTHSPMGDERSEVAADESDGPVSASSVVSMRRPEFKQLGSAGILRQTQDALGNDVALHDRRSTTNRQRLGVKEPVVPGIAVGAVEATRALSGNHPRRSRQSMR